MLIEWLKGNAEPDRYVEVSETNPIPIKSPSTLVHSGSIQGKVTISAVPAALKIGASAVSGRHTLIIHNDASNIIYIGFNSDVSSDDGWQVSSGTALTFKFDPLQPVTVYGVMDEGTTQITLLELK